MNKDFANNNIEKFLGSEIKKIEIEKWAEGIRIESDPGQNFILDWISLSADTFRVMWNESKCKDCSKSKNCGWSVEKECVGFKSDTICS